MTNLQSIAGGAVWMFISGLLIFAALEPVTVDASAPIEVASVKSEHKAA